MFMLIIKILLIYLIIGLFFGLIINWGINDVLKEDEQNNLIMWVLIVFNSLLWPSVILRCIKDRKKNKGTKDELKKKLIEFQEKCINSAEEDP